MSLNREPELNIKGTFLMSAAIVRDFAGERATHASGLTAIAMLAAGILVTKAIYQLDATVRGRS